MPYKDKAKQNEYLRKYRRKSGKVWRNLLEKPCEVPIKNPETLTEQPHKKRFIIITKGEQRSRAIQFYYKMIASDYDYIIWVRNCKRYHKEMNECFQRLWEAKPQYKY